MISDVRKIKKGTLLVIERPEISAFYNNKRSTLEKGYKLYKGDVIFVLEVVEDVYDLNSNPNMGNDYYASDIYFKAMHGLNDIFLYVKNIHYKKNFPKNLQKDLYATFNYSIILSN